VGHCECAHIASVSSSICRLKILLITPQHVDGPCLQQIHMCADVPAAGISKAVAVSSRSVATLQMLHVAVASAACCNAASAARRRCKRCMSPLQSACDRLQRCRRCKHCMSPLQVLHVAVASAARLRCKRCMSPLQSACDRLQRCRRCKRCMSPLQALHVAVASAARRRCKRCMSSLQSACDRLQRCRCCKRCTSPLQALHVAVASDACRRTTRRSGCRSRGPCAPCTAAQPPTLVHWRPMCRHRVRSVGYSAGEPALPARRRAGRARPRTSAARRSSTCAAHLRKCAPAATSCEHYRAVVSGSMSRCAQMQSC
jgi:hypothetical protein